MKNYIKVISVILVFCLMSLTLAGCSNNKRQIGLSSDSLASNSGVIEESVDINIEGAAFEGTFPAPKFKNGAYTLVSKTTQDTVLDSNGSILTGLARTYEYTLNVTANSDGSANIKYTFDRIIITYSQLGANPVTADTSGDCPDYYKEIIGKSFTASIDANGNYASSSGIKELLASNANFTDKLGLSEESLISVVKDTFYSLPANINGETSFFLTQGSSTEPVEIYYRAAMLKDNRVAFSFKEQTDSVPESLVGAATITNYKSYQPANGTLWVSLDDRTLVEYSSYSKISYSMEMENTLLDLTATMTGSSKITAK